jgi:hypothetical protein
MHGPGGMHGPAYMDRHHSRRSDSVPWDPGMPVSVPWDACFCTLGCLFLYPGMPVSVPWDACFCTLGCMFLYPGMPVSACTLVLSMTNGFFAFIGLLSSPTPFPYQYFQLKCWSAQAIRSWCAHGQNRGQSVLCLFRHVGTSFLFTLK